MKKKKKSTRDYDVEDYYKELREQAKTFDDLPF